MPPEEMDVSRVPLTSFPRRCSAKSFALLRSCFCLLLDMPGRARMTGSSPLPSLPRPGLEVEVEVSLFCTAGDVAPSSDDSVTSSESPLSLSDLLSTRSFPFCRLESVVLLRGRILLFRSTHDLPSS